MLSAPAIFWAAFASAASSSAFEITLRVARSRERSTSAFASSASASAERNCASSEEASSLMRRSPFFASAPFSNPISVTVPPSSVATVAPCIAEIDPTEGRTGAQSTSLTSALLTVSTGIGGFELIILRICSPFTPPMMRTMRPNPIRAKKIGPHEPLDALGFIFNSSQRWLRFRAEEQAPEIARELYLALATFRAGPIRREHVAHQHSVIHGENHFGDLTRLKIERQIGRFG